MQPWRTPFPIWNQSVVPCPVLTVVSWPAYRFLRRQVRWPGIPMSLKFFSQFVMIHTVKGFSVVNEAEVDVFLEFSCFSMIQGMLAIWSLVILPFLNPAWTSGSSWLIYWWSLAWRILSIFYESVRWVQLCSSLSILWHCLSLGLEWKWPFPVLWPPPSFPNLLAYWAQHFHRIIF